MALLTPVYCILEIQKQNEPINVALKLTCVILRTVGRGCIILTNRSQNSSFFREGGLHLHPHCEEILVNTKTVTHLQKC